MIIVQKQKYNKGRKEKGILQLSSAKIASELDIPIYTPKIKCRNTNGKVIINWGNSNIPWLTLDIYRSAEIILNPPLSVATSANKLSTFRTLEDSIRTALPNWTTDISTAESWFEDGQKIVLCRTKLTGSSGEGIIIARNKEELVDCNLYVKYIPKKWEYRVHIFNDKVIHIQQKRRLTSEQLEQRGILERNKLIRNLKNGYIFSNSLSHQEDSLIISKLKQISLTAINCLNLDFGAVDLIVTGLDEVYLLEVNTAPGLEGSTLQKYIEAFKELKEVNTNELFIRYT